MKRIIFSLMIVMMALTTTAQNDVTKFLGIPVDGTKAEMIRKLKAKGFTPSPYDKDILTGEFNGRDVRISIQTINNKVWRLIVADESPTTETNIRIRFNNLCEQFNNSSKYITSLSDQTIPQTEDISYQMSVNSKRYEALFFQRPENSTLLYDYNENKYVWFTIIESSYSTNFYIAIYYENGYNAANGEDL